MYPRLLDTYIYICIYIYIYIYSLVYQFSIVDGLFPRASVGYYLSTAIVTLVDMTVERDGWVCFEISVFRVCFEILVVWVYYQTLLVHQLSPIGQNG